MLKIKDNVDLKELDLIIRSMRVAKMFPFRKLKISKKDTALLLDYIEQLENNWNELKEWLEEERKKIDKNNTTARAYLKKIEPFMAVLSKMQEIEGGVDNE